MAASDKRQFSIRIGTILAATALLWGCESMPEVVPETPSGIAEPARVVVQTDPRVTRLLAYHAAAPELPAERARQEYRVLNGQLIGGVCDEPRLQAAMLLLNPALASSATAKRVAGLLLPCITAPLEHEAAFTHLAEILQRQLFAQRRIRAAARRQLQLQRKLEAADARIDGLNRKLDELKRIERSIRERQ